MRLWYIENVKDSKLRWSNSHGWVTDGWDFYDQELSMKTKLPDDGIWKSWEGAVYILPY